jgi:hypothetical protein
VREGGGEVWQRKKSYFRAHTAVTEKKIPYFRTHTIIFLGYVGHAGYKGCRQQAVEVAQLIIRRMEQPVNPK